MSKHDPLCLVAKGPCCPWMGNCICQCICDWIEEVRVDERRKTMTQYVQLRESDTYEEDIKFYEADPRRMIMVEQVANALFDAWFPQHPEKGPTGEDFENWHNIACADAVVAVKTLIKNVWLDDPALDDC